MASNSTLARPYAEAVFRRAIESDSLDTWSGRLKLLAAIMADKAMSGLVSNPHITRAQLADLVLGVAGDKLSGEGANLVRLLAQNGRLATAPELAEIYEASKNEHERRIDVELTSAFPVDEEHTARLAEALKARLGRDVHITSKHDESLIGGVKIRAGDMVIDGSVRGRLEQLATELGT